MPQGISQHLDCLCQSLVPCQLLFSGLKLMLTQPKVCPPQLIQLASNLKALMLPACPQHCNFSCGFHVTTSVTRALTLLLAAATGRTGITAFRLIARKP